VKIFKVIESRDNALIKLIVALQSTTKSRKENGLFVLEGLRICEDAFENNIQFDKFIVSNTAFSKLKKEVEVLSENAVDCYKIPDTLFKKISDTMSPQGILAIAKMPEGTSNNINPKGRYIALENVADPSNLGAVARTAEALGVSGIFLSNNGCDPYSPKALRASMGTLLRMPVIVLENFEKEIAKLGLKTYSAVVESNATPITRIDFSDGCCIIIGNEANGITEETRKNSDVLFTIPMSGRAESLNAAVAASISIWEMMK
jgi:TrmH family RNA methyltransferase